MKFYIVLLVSSAKLKLKHFRIKVMYVCVCIYIVYIRKYCCTRNLNVYSLSNQFKYLFKIIQVT